MTESEPAVYEELGAPPAPAAGPRQFDFWLGDWDVTWGEGERGRNRVEAILDGQVVLENFDGQPASPLRGLSVSVYSPALDRWRQTWVDNSGNYWAFSGRFEDGRMVLGTEVEREGRPVRLRMVWFNLQPDAFDWHWERSDDGGQTWTVLWQLRYARRPGTRAA
jgi:hypothetical protein